MVCMSTFTVSARISKPIDIVWQRFTQPAHIEHWSFENAERQVSETKNDLRIGGQFDTSTAAKDGSGKVEMVGTYTEVVDHERIAYTLDSGRKVLITFQTDGDATTVEEVVDREDSAGDAVEPAGWQTILDTFKAYCERD